MPLIILVFLVNIVWAEPIVSIHSDTFSITHFKLSYFIDNKKNLNFSQIQKQKFIEGFNKDSLGVDIVNTWIKIQLFNAIDKNQILFLHQDTAYLNTKIRYFELDATDTLVQKKELFLYYNESKDMMDGSDSIFKIDLKMHESKTIYINQETLAYHFYNFSILSEKESRHYLVIEKIDAVLFVGLLFALSLYNLFIFISSRYKEYLYYSLYLLSATIWIFYIYGGLSHYFHIYGNFSYYFNFALIFMPIFLAFFVQSIFETKEKYLIEHKFLNSIIVILFLNFLYGLFDFKTALAFISIALNYALIVFMCVSISIYRKGDKIITFFLYAHTFYLIFSIYSLFFYMGLVEFSYLSSHGIGIGIVIEALLLSYLVSYKFKTIEEEKENERVSKIKVEKEHAKSQVLLLQKSKMADMGEMIASIAHQWRQPLTVIGISVGILRERKLLNLLSDKNFEEELSHIDLNIAHMSETVENFLTYFRPDKSQEDFCIDDVVNKALFIMKNPLEMDAIKIIVNIDKKYKISGFKEEYMQVLISILSNAIYALKKCENKEIEIATVSKENNITLEISDNAGGIPSDIILRVFEPYFTTKNQQVGTGLGLYISKIIIEKSMNGSLGVSNTAKGAKFCITI